MVRYSRRAYSVVAMESSGLLDDLLVNHPDILSAPVAIAPERILGHAGLVLRRELVADLGLHLGQGGAVGRRLLHGGDEVAEIAAEEREMALGQDLAVSGDDMREVELLHGAEGLHPALRVAVVQKRHPVDQRIAGGDD